jgi:hypothetical protein
MARKKTKAGRPPRHVGEHLRKNRTFRVRDRLDVMLEESAKEAGRSVSEEIEHRLEVSFEDERQNADLLGTHVGAHILRMLRAAMVVEGVSPEWDGDPARAERFRTAANAVIAAFLNLPIDLPAPGQESETAKELLLRFPPRHGGPE